MGAARLWSEVSRLSGHQIPARWCLVSSIPELSTPTWRWFGGHVSRPFPNRGTPLEEGPRARRQESFDGRRQRPGGHEREQDVAQGRAEEAGQERAEGLEPYKYDESGGLGNTEEETQDERAIKEEEENDWSEEEKTNIANYTMNNFNAHDGSCGISSLDLFAARNVQDQVLESVPEIIHPINSLTGTRVIEFVVTGNENFIDMHNIELQLKVRIKNNDNSNLPAVAAAVGQAPAAGQIALINYPIASLFKQLDVFLNNDLVSSSDNYGLKSYVETLANFGHDASKSWLQAGGYYKDTHNQMNALSDDNEGFKYRRNLLAQSRMLELSGKIHSELFNQANLLLNHVDLRIILTRHSDDFCLYAADGDNVKIEIMDASIKLHRSVVATKVSNAVEALLQKQDIRYFVDRGVVKSYTFAPGSLDINIRNSVTSHDIPTKMIVFMLTNTAYNGSKAENPYNFQHFNMTSADITINSQSAFAKPLAGDFATGQYLQFFNTIPSGMGYKYADAGCLISREEYPNGFTFICADFTATQCNAQYEDPTRSGNLDIALKFSQPLAVTVNVIVYTEAAPNTLASRAR